MIIDGVTSKINHTNCMESSQTELTKGKTTHEMTNLDGTGISRTPESKGYIWRYLVVED